MECRPPETLVSQVQDDQAQAHHHTPDLNAKASHQKQLKPIRPALRNARTYSLCSLNIHHLTPKFSNSLLRLSAIFVPLYMGRFAVHALLRPYWG